MVEKVSHIKNPLTVIAIFAGLAEVSGTAVLPILKPETQRVYVWFLMVFPGLLVLLFFITLLLKHYVLYAPSDFRDDQLFADLFTHGSSAVRVKKLGEEVSAEAKAESRAEADPGLAANSMTEERPEMPRTESSEHLVLSVDPKLETKSDENKLESAYAKAESIINIAKSVNDNIRSNIHAKALLAEEMVIEKLSSELGIQFKRNLSLRRQPNIMFDAVATTQKRTIVAEIKYTRHGILPPELIRRTFDQVKTFVDSLPSEVANNFEFIYAVAVEGEATKRTNMLKVRILNIANEYSFRTRIHIYDFNDLEMNFKMT